MAVIVGRSGTRWTLVGVTPEHDTRAVWDGDLLVGYGQLRVSLTTDHEGLAEEAVRRAHNEAFEGPLGIGPPHR